MIAQFAASLGVAINSVQITRHRSNSRRAQVVDPHVQEADRSESWGGSGVSTETFSVSIDSDVATLPSLLANLQTQLTTASSSLRTAPIMSSLRVPS
eukprot:SAG31_NODE_36531_length_312_cov_0.976526_1_plen_96_part_10